MSYHEQLGVSAERFETILDRFNRRSHDGLPYRHLPDYRNDLDRGTVLIEGSVIPGFPKVPRTLYLETGIPRFFDDELIVEEKLNGYNTRVVLVDGRILAFTRSGLICPFTTHVVRSQLSLDPFFDEYPDLVLCGELIGPENPYTVHDYPDVDSVAFRAFDVRKRPDGTPLPISERRARCEEFAIPQTRHLGSFEAADAASSVRSIIDRLDDDDREGVVMKTPDGRRQLKYTTSAANRGDLAFAFSLPFDYGRSFMFRRLLREGFQAVEWGDVGAVRGDEAALEWRAHALGESILLSMVETIERVNAGDDVGESRSARAPPPVIEALFEHFQAMGLQVEVDVDRTTGDERYVRFRKKARSTNDRTRNYLDGHIVTE